MQVQDSFSSKLLLEAIKTLFSLVLLVVTWYGGQSIITYWDYRKKRNEIEISSAQRFFELYGEFKAIMRLWKVFCVNTGRAPAAHAPTNGIVIPTPDETRWQLLKRAADAESGVESLILKLAAERNLTEKQMAALGLFRQAYQTLRQAIRENEWLHWTYDCPEYVLFNNLASDFARMISLDKAPTLDMIQLDDSPEHPTSQGARENLQVVTSYRSPDFDQCVKQIGPGKKHKSAGCAYP
jgi:hypothetical protein